MTKKMGRPPKFDNAKKLWQAFEEWKLEFEVGGKLETEIPDVESFCWYVDAYRDLLNEYEHKKNFSDTVKKIKAWIHYRKKQLAMTGKIPPAIYIFDAKNNSGYVDKSEVDEKKEVFHKYEELDDEEIIRRVKARKDRVLGTT